MNSLPVLNTVTARELQRDYKSIVKKAKSSKEPIMMISNNEPQLIMLSPETFKRYASSYSRQALWDTISSIQADNTNTQEKEVESAVLAAIKRARMKPYAKYSRRSR